MRPNLPGALRPRRGLLVVCLASLAWLPFAYSAMAGGHSEYDAMVTVHAKANHVPEELVHRVIMRESRYQPRLVGRGGTIGLMQIKLATARSLGYTGDAEGLRDPDTNLTYGVKYLAGAYRAANGDHARAIHYYAAGYYQIAKRQRRALRSASHRDIPGSPLQLLPTSAPAEIASSPDDPAVPQPPR